MGWSVTVVPVGSLPPMRETIVSFSSCPGNICTSVELLGFKKLPHLPREEQIAALEKMIHELNKDSGVFTDQYFVDCDKQWSDGRESRELWSQWEKVKANGGCPPDVLWLRSYEAYTGHIGRERLLEDAERFYLILKAGYELKLEW